ncbi:MAG: hypothetical protein IKL47_10705 [Clostridia bacterium]|nr:hypothetical protein [Clostridia bacterium]
MKIIMRTSLSVLAVTVLLFAGAGISAANSDDSGFVTQCFASESMAVPDDGIIITEDDNYCSCCHSHEHTKSVFDRYACFFCKVGRFFRSMFGKDETDVIHKYLLISSLSPTCFDTGERAYECAVCKESISFTDEKLTHVPVPTEGKAASCTEDGISEGSKCSLCDTVLVPQNIIPALGHDEIIDYEISPTCTESGISEGKHCGRCTLVITEQQTLPPTGHDFADGDTVSDLKTYKTGTGRATADITCCRCSQVLSDFPIDAAASVGGYGKIYHTLEAAVKAAKNQTVYLINDYTLKKNITVGNGITLVIPCFVGDTGYTVRDDEGYYSKYCPDNPTQEINIHSFRRLSVPSDITITVANTGTVLISAVTGLFGGGNPASYGISGGYGEIELAGTINVQNGGIFDCSGYVTDTGGEVNLANGAKMFETYGILYWRGGSYAYAANSKDIFPIDGYEMNYMRAKLNISYGAVLAGNCKMCAGNLLSGQSQYYYCHFKLIGNSDGFLYRMKNGARVERVVENDGKTVVRAYGDFVFGIANINAGIMNLKTSSFQAYKVDGKLRFEFYDGTITCNQKCQFMPGAEMIVGKGAVFNISESGALVFCTAKDYTVNGNNYPGYYSFDSRYAGALYPAGRDDAKLYVKDGGKVVVKGSSIFTKACLAGMVYIDSSSTVDFSKNYSTSATLKVATGAISGASIFASVKAEEYTVPYIRNTLS